MTDVFVAYAREDRERVRPIADILREMGWDVWFDASEHSLDVNPVADTKLARAGAILVVWSEHARRSENVRSEAATGLYKNKLVQVRIDGGSPPRPFDQVDAVDLARWMPGSEDADWRRLVSQLRNCAGEPVAAKSGGRGGRAAPRMLVLRGVETVDPVPPPPPLRSAPDPATRWAELVEPVAPPPPRPQPATPPLAPPPVAPPVSVAPPPPPQATYFPPPPPAPPREPEERGVYMRPMETYERRAPPPLPPPPRYDEPLERPTMHRVSEPTYRMPAEGRMDRLPHADLGYKPAEGNRAGWVGPGMVAAAVALIGSGIGIWFGDPFGWRVGAGASQGDTLAMAVRDVPDAAVANGEPAGRYEDTDASDESWRRVDRKSVEALRDFVADFPRSSPAATARAELRVMDAQAWVKAVTADNETAYRAYLTSFPTEGALPGAMAAAAQARLAELDAERAEAIEEIQRGLATANLYSGETSGEADAATTRAVKAFATSSRAKAPDLATAAPRDLRAFAATMRGAAAPSRESQAALAAAQEADRKRLAQAQAASAAASVAATQPLAAPAPGDADALAAAQQRRIAESEAWDIAERAGTLDAHRAYVAAWPEGSHASEARAAIAKLSRPAPFSLDQLSPEVREAVEAARRAQTTANQRAAAARQAAASTESLTNAQSITGADGDRYTTQISGGAPNGLGVRVRGSGVNAGDRYRGELRNGQRSGVGVYEFADNPGNASARAARYEGEHSGDVASGHGVMHWRSGDSFAGQNAGGPGQARGVLTYANGLRYEGEMSNGQRQGLGVVWAADGDVAQAGRWARDELAEGMKK